MTAEELPAWAFPPPGGFTADDLDRMPHLPPHTELIDGSLVFVSPQRYFHTLAMYLLEAGMRRTAPEDVRFGREMSLVLGKRNRPEPDLMALKAGAVATRQRGKKTGFQPEDVLLAVEVVSEESEERDRKRKPQLYAEAGIPHFWRVEEAEGMRPVVYVYELDPATAAYSLTGIFREQLKLSVPFTIDIDLAEIDRL